MSEFETIRTQLQQARGNAAQSGRAVFLAREKLNRIEAAQKQLQRKYDADNPRHQQQQAELGQQRLNTVADVARLNAEHDDHLQGVASLVSEFIPFTDPREHVSRFNDDTPFMLMPVRLETRFVTITGASGQQPQLWIRIYPDTCAVDNFEAVLSESEIAAAKTFWAMMWRAGGVQDDERAAWRALVASLGSGRAAWAVKNYPPLNPGDAPVKSQPQDIILVIGTDTPLSAAQNTAAGQYWQAVWRAFDDAQAQSQAMQDLITALGEERARIIAEHYQPVNLADQARAPFSRETVPLQVVTVVFAKPQDTDSKQTSWTQAAKVNIMPERFVLSFYSGGKKVHELIGAPLSSPLVVGPDPSAPRDEQLQLRDGEVVWTEEMLWMVDFDRAVASGLGFKLDLTDEQARLGFDRIVALGVRLGADAQTGKTELETLWRHQQYSRGGFSIVAQGTPTNNTDEQSSGLSREENADDSFEQYVKQQSLYTETTDWMQKRDGQWLAEIMGLQSGHFQHVSGGGGQDQCEAKAMNTALWPATLGYFMDTMMDTVFDENTIDATRWFFNHFVSGRGLLPAVRVGRQPYGILPATAFSRAHWMHARTLNPFHGLPHPQGYRQYLQQIHAVLQRTDDDWLQFSKQVAYVGKAGDPQQTLLDALGLHATSVEYYQRYAQSLQQLFNRLNLEGLGGILVGGLIAAGYLQSAMDLLQQLGYDGDDPPDILNTFFLNTPNPLNGDLIDDRPLSESAPIRAYTPPPDAKNYIAWLIEAANTSLETVRLQQGFADNKAPTALLYILLRHAVQLGYWDAGLQLYRGAELLDPAAYSQARAEPHFVHVATTAAAAQAAPSESRWFYLYQNEPRITEQDELLVADYIPTVIGKVFATRYLHDQINALSHLENTPTARLERLLAEHIDCCTYRRDAWQLGLVHYQLAMMRYRDNHGTQQLHSGVYLGMFGWLEDIRPENKKLTPVRLQPDLDEIFNKPGSGPLMRDNTNAGYVHAPSLNHAVTAAVLRNGYLSNATPSNPDTLAVNLSSARVRKALGILEGIRNGQSLSALLGYRFERGLHDAHNLAEVDAFIYKLRKAFALRADRMQSTLTDPDVPVQAIEARNVLDGLKLVDHVQSTGQRFYPFGKDLPPASAAQADAINTQVNRLLDLHDAVADLAMAEGVHQAVQGNYERAAATLDTYSKANFPPEPDVVQTPRSGVNLTHRVAIQFPSGLDGTVSPVPVVAMTPRARLEPAVNAWLAGILPAPDQVATTVEYFDFTTQTQTSVLVNQQQLQLQPLDMLYLLDMDSEQQMHELDDRVVHYVISHTPTMRGDSDVQIKYSRRIAGKISFFELAALTRSLRTVLLSSRPLAASDVQLQQEAGEQSDQNVSMDKQRLLNVRTALLPLQTQAIRLHGELDVLFADPETNRATIVSQADQRLGEYINLVHELAGYGIPDTGSGFTYDHKRSIYRALIGKVDERVSRWQDRIVQFNQAMAEYAALPGTATDEEKFNALQKAETTVSTELTVPFPTAVTDMETIVQNKKSAFDAKRNQFTALLPVNTPAVFNLFAQIRAELPLTAFDSVAFDVDDQEQQMFVLVQGLWSRLTTLVADLAKRISDMDAKITDYDSATVAAKKVQALTQGMQVLFGEGFKPVPEFTLQADHADEWANAHGASDTTLAYVKTHVPRHFPVDDWLYGVARVRAKLQQWENIVLLTQALQTSEPDLVPIQLPFRSNDTWLGLEIPPDYDNDGERLLYTAHYAQGFDKAAAQCGVLLDEWTEVIPTRDETTGITFHYDRPNCEPPQSMLLVTPPVFDGQWQWADLIDAVNETLDFAKLRAVEPRQLDSLSYARFLPAVIMASTMRPITIAADLAVNNNMQAYIEAGDNG